MKPRGRPAWFKCRLDLSPLIRAADTEDVGEAFKAAYTLLEYGEEPDDEQFPGGLSRAIYTMLRAAVMDACYNYDAAVAAGKRGGRPLKESTKESTTE